ncbi:hypothetical protein GCM10007989_08830 [Devosia pacifica]|uniref:Uncharacterized protein n=1 Tax=Devosia pacifica TaxID=1335967 RepID=A0A918VR30_9HYPH|nr:hypothetical protein [Devosia pacifica]GHA16062.1 hypothetical protein GCM10007989_08830 [Devosia pacifica]
MHIKTLVSTFAIGAALAFAGPAAAQTMINGTEISEDDMAAVEARCDELFVASATDSIANDNDDGIEEDNDSAGSIDATIEDAPDVNDLENATTTIDLDTIDLQACMDAGLVGMEDDAM